MTWAFGFFGLALFTGVLGFTGAWWAGKVLFFLFLVLTLVALVAHAFRPRSFR